MEMKPREVADSDFSLRIYESIKRQFEEDGTLAKLRSQLHVKVLQVVAELQTAPGKPLCGLSLEVQSSGNDPRLLLVNELIMEYLNWYGCMHTMETFAMETGAQPESPKREQLESALGEFEQQQVPILLELVMRQQVATQLGAGGDAGGGDELKPSPSKPPKSPSKIVLNGNEGKSAEIDNSKELSSPKCAGIEMFRQLKKLGKQHSCHMMLQLQKERNKAAKKGNAKLAAADKDQVNDSKAKDQQQLVTRVGQMWGTNRKYNNYSSSSSSIDLDSLNVPKPQPIQATEDKDKLSEVSDDIEFDFFEGMPEGHFYEELDPGLPEKPYAAGCGEELAWMEINNDADDYQKETIQLTSPRRATKRKAVDVPMLFDQWNDLNKSTGNTKNVQQLQNLELNLSKLLDRFKEDVEAERTTRKRSIVQFEQTSESSQDDSEQAVSKDNCPSTMISEIQLASDEESEVED